MASLIGNIVIGLLLLSSPFVLSMTAMGHPQGKRFGFSARSHYYVDRQRRLGDSLPPKIFNYGPVPSRCYSAVAINKGMDNLRCLNICATQGEESMDFKKNCGLGKNSLAEHIN